MKFRGFIAVFICFLLVSLLLFSSNVTVSVREALLLCAVNVIPSLFPFLVITKLFLKLNLADSFPRCCKKIMKPLFSLGETSFSALFLGLISGYPIGASVCTSLYQGKQISRREAERLLAFCNNAGPAFILSTIGAGAFGSLKIGTILLCIHILSAILVGISFRLVSPLKDYSIKKDASATNESFSFAFTDSVYSATISSLSISAYIVFFSVLVMLLKKLPFLPSHPVLTFFFGLLEITSGAFQLMQNADIKTAFILISALLGWGGLCVHFQALSFISATDLGVFKYFLGKGLQALISAILAFFISKSSIFDTVAVFGGTATDAQVNVDFSILIILSLIFYLFFKKGWKKPSV